MTVVRFKNLNVGRSRPSNKFPTHSIGNENLGYNKEDTGLQEEGLLPNSAASEQEREEVTTTVPPSEPPR
jgi:hypothetical protein